MTRATIRAWFLIHKWSSLVSTIFLLILCVTGLPLIFHDEIDALTGSNPAAAMTGAASAGTGPGLVPLDTLVAKAMAARPGEVPLFIGFDDQRPVLTVTTGPMPDASEAAMTVQIFDRATGRPAGALDQGGVMAFLLALHVDLFLGLPGMLFVGAMGLLFIVAIVSGVVLYAPFMRRQPFGTLRVRRSARVRWLDTHNLLGVVTLAWASVVGLTGVINTLATPIVAAWQADELAEMTAAYAGMPALPPARWGSADRALAAARAARPGSVPQFIAFPGGAFSSRHHHAVFLKGDTPLTKKMLTPALVDAATGQVTDIRPLPWYVQSLLVSQPLHFGDYGGLPLKILWALLDLATIVVLGSGLWLWAARRRAPTETRVEEIARGGTMALR